MHVVTVTFEAKPGFEEPFLARVRRQAADSLALEPGCRRFDVCRDDANPRLVFLYEIYDNPAAFDAHLASAHFHAFSDAIADWVADKSVQSWTLIDPAEAPS